MLSWSREGQRGITTMKDYEREISISFLCASCSKGIALDDNETMRNVTLDERISENCCSSGSYSEYYGASTQTWHCSNTVSKAIEVSTLQPC